MAISKPLKWHGGKHYLASRIVAMMPPHVHYVEPFFGGGSVLFAKPSELIENHSEVINDLNGELTNFWTVLRDADSFAAFNRIIDATPFAKPVWEEACRSRGGSAVQRAVNFFVCYRQSRQGLGRDFATMSRLRARRGMNEQVSSWLSAIEGLHEAHLRLQRVAIFNESAVSVIRREDDRESFFYCDPPYVHATREVANAYTHEMQDSDHATLLITLGRLTGKFILSGYRCDLYDEAARQYGWKRIDVEIDNKASGAKVKQVKTECLWANYDIKAIAKGGA